MSNYLQTERAPVLKNIHSMARGNGETTRRAIEHGAVYGERAGAIQRAGGKATLLGCLTRD